MAETEKLGMASRERPWGWVVVAASFVSQVLVFGLCWSVGIYNLIFLEVFDAPKGVTSWVGSLTMATVYGAGPVASILTNKYGCRVATIIGSLVGFVGLTISCFAPNIYFLMASFGVLTGFGTGLCFIPSITIVNYYFDKRRSFAVGLAVSGVGVGTFVFPPLIRILYLEFGWRGSLLIIAAVILNVSVCGALMRPIRLEQLTGDSSLKLMNLGLFRNYGFFCLCLNNLLVFFGMSVVYIHLSAYAESTGADSEQSAYLISAIGISNIAGRILFGAMGQLKQVDVTILYTVAFSLSGFTIILIPLIQDYLYVMCFGSAFGFLSGCLAGLSNIIELLIGLKDFTNGFGLIQIFEGVGSLTGGPIAGWLFDLVKHYDVSLYVGGAVLILSFVVMIGSIVKIRSGVTQSDVIEVEVTQEEKPMLS